jgi:hypothetical protein
MSKIMAWGIVAATFLLAIAAHALNWYLLSICITAVGLILGYMAHSDLKISRQNDAILARLSAMEKMVDEIIDEEPEPSEPVKTEDEALKQIKEGLTRLLP